MSEILLETPVEFRFVQLSVARCADRLPSFRLHAQSAARAVELSAAFVKGYFRVAKAQLEQVGASCAALRKAALILVQWPYARVFNACLEGLGRVG